MSALSAQTRISYDGSTKSNIEYWEVTTEGTTGGTISTSLRTVNFAQATWAEDIGGTGHVPEVVITSRNIVTLTVSGGINKKCYVMLVGF